MRNRPITALVQCSSPESLSAAENAARAKVDSGEVVSVKLAFPRGIEHRTTEHHRIHDYFREIHIERQSDATAFFVVFDPLENAGSFWRDMMVGILQTIRAVEGVVSITPVAARP